MDAIAMVLRFVQRRFQRGAQKRLRQGGPPPLPQGRFDVADAPGPCYTLGFAKTDIMPADLPEKTYWVAGYRIRNRAVGVLDPMTCSAVWLDDNTGRGGVFLVTVDNVGMSSYDSDQVSAPMQAELADMHCRGVFICSTHNHAGIDTTGYWGPLPLTGRNPKYMKILHEGIRRVMREAFAARREGKLFHGTIDAPPVLRDTRLPEIWSNTLTRLRFVPRDGSHETWLINFACHSESLLGRNSLVSADFPCYLRRRIKEKTGAETAYFIGCEGGLIRPKELDEDNIKSTILCGELLADAAIAIHNDRPLPPLIGLITQPYYADLENILLLACAKFGIVKSDKWTATGAGSMGYSLRTEMSFLSLGGLELLLLPCELFPELAYGGYLDGNLSCSGKGPEVNPVPLCEIAGNPDLLIFNLCNDMTGYVVPPNDWMLHPTRPYLEGCRDAHDRRHYEESNSLGPRTAEIVAEVFAGMMRLVRC